MSFAEQVARMPRDIGTRSGVKLTLTVPSTRVERFWVISGVCRWVPPTPYALALPMISLPSRCALAALPAPLVPDAATTVTSGSMIPAAIAGARVRVEMVG